MGVGMAPLIVFEKHPSMPSVKCALCEGIIIVGWSAYRSTTDGENKKYYHTETRRNCLKLAGIPFNESQYE
jgi:hypothetical protein